VAFPSRRGGDRDGLAEGDRQQHVLQGRISAPPLRKVRAAEDTSTGAAARGRRSRFLFCPGPAAISNTSGPRVTEYEPGPSRHGRSDRTAASNWLSRLNGGGAPSRGPAGLPGPHRERRRPPAPGTGPAPCWAASDGGILQEEDASPAP